MVGLLCPVCRKSLLSTKLSSAVEVTFFASYCLLSNGSWHRVAFFRADQFENWSSMPRHFPVISLQDVGLRRATVLLLSVPWRRQMMSNEIETLFGSGPFSFLHKKLFIKAFIVHMCMNIFQNFSFTAAKICCSSYGEYWQEDPKEQTKKTCWRGLQQSPWKN